MNSIKKTFSVTNNLNDIAQFKVKTKVLLCVNLLIVLITFILSHEFTNLIGWISLLASIASLINLMLCDEGKITNYSWGLVESILFLFIDLENRLIGDLATNIYYIITQIIGIFLWNSAIEKQKDKNIIKPKKLKFFQIIGIIFFIIIIYAVVIYFSKKLNGTQIYLDATLLPLSIVGMLLMMGGYRSQWIIWILWDLVALMIWYKQFKVLSPASASMFVLEIMKLVNGLYGAYMWFFENNKVKV